MKLFAKTQPPIGYGSLRPLMSSLLSQATEEELVLLQLLSFLLEGVLQLVICCCGILGNTISILLLLGKHMKVGACLGPNSR